MTRSATTSTRISVSFIAVPSFRAIGLLGTGNTAHAQIAQFWTTKFRFTADFVRSVGIMGVGRQGRTDGSPNEVGLSCLKQSNL